MELVHLKSKADKLFQWFEDNRFQNHLHYSRSLNLVLEFCDYVEHLDDDDLAQELKTSDPRDIQAFRSLINNGIDTWLDSRIKTICY